MRKLAACLPLIFIACIAFAQPSSVESIRDLRLQGRLSDALIAAAAQLDGADKQTAFELHLEMAKIHDRVGLHDNTRPVAAALQNIKLAAAIAEDLDALAEAEVGLAYAEFYYQAEMSERVFAAASTHARTARDMFALLDDYHGQADAVHRLGLISLQQGELQVAHKLFDESLELDRAAGERGLLRADYERHVGFVYALQDDVAVALPFFERSLEFRINAGAVDASMFAAISVASALIELGRGDEARPHIDYAMRIANDIGSDTGLSRTENLLAKL
jgi:tetratricopeptide (TPR) repeat protein